MEFIIGKHYMLSSAEGLIEVEFSGSGSSNSGAVFGFKDIKTGKEYVIAPELAALNINEVRIVATDGVKYDGNKLLWGLLPLEAVQEIVRVLTFGAKKYAKDNWKYVVDARERYYDAMQRHIIAWKLGERADKETGIHPLAHAGCCLLFILWLDLTQKRDIDV